MADHRRLRQLLKRPRPFRRWPLAAYALIGVLVAVIVLAIFGAVVFRPHELPPKLPSDQWAAEGVIFGAGAFVLAVLATAIATVAYINSTERPKLRVEANYNWRPPPEPASGAYPDWALRLSIYNDGPVAARNLAVRVTFRDAVSLVKLPTHALPGQWQTASPDDPWPSQVWWEGGADAVVHPSPDWPYQVPQLGRSALQVFDPESVEPVTFTVEVVADDVAPLMETFTLQQWHDDGAHLGAGRDTTTESAAPSTD